MVIPALSLLVAGVHHPIDGRLMGCKNASGVKHGVDQGCLAVIDVARSTRCCDRRTWGQL